MKIRRGRATVTVALTKALVARRRPKTHLKVIVSRLDSIGFCASPLSPRAEQRHRLRLLQRDNPFTVKSVFHHEVYQVQNPTKRFHWPRTTLLLICMFFVIPACFRVQNAEDSEDSDSSAGTDTAIFTDSTDPAVDTTIPTVTSDTEDFDDSDETDAQKDTGNTDTIHTDTAYGPHITDKCADVRCDDNFVCNEETGHCVPSQDCPVPQAPALTIVDNRAVPVFSTFSDLDDHIKIGAIVAATPNDPSLNPLEPNNWTASTSFAFTASADTVWVKLFAQVDAPDRCKTGPIFSHVYEVRREYPGHVGTPGTTAIKNDSKAFVSWASDFTDYTPGEGVAVKWQTPEKALGRADGTSSDIVCLGDGGTITLVFSPTINNGAGWDFAVFENGFASGFHELAYVEVSSNGTDFVRFDNAFSGTAATGDKVSKVDTTLVGSLAGKYKLGYGNPFDLEALANKPEVNAGLVNLKRISHVRLVDIVGDGTYFDSFKNAIADVYPTLGSAGFDLDAIGVINSN